MSDEIDISTLDKAEVLAALYNAAQPQGLGFLQYDPTPMTVDEAREILQHQTWFDYLKGRVLKVDLYGPTLDPRWYDRDNGAGTARQAIEAIAGDFTLRQTVLQDQRQRAKQKAQEVQQELGTPTTSYEAGEVVVVQMGMSDVASELAPALEKAMQYESGPRWPIRHG